MDSVQIWDSKFKLWNWSFQTGGARYWYILHLVGGRDVKLHFNFFARDDWTKWQGEMQDTKRTGRVSCYNIKPIIQMKGFLIVSPACKCLVFEFVSWMLGLSILCLVGRWLCKTRPVIVCTLYFVFVSYFEFLCLSNGGRLTVHIQVVISRPRLPRPPPSLISIY